MRKKDLLNIPCDDPNCEETQRNNRDHATTEKENMLTEQDLVDEFCCSLTFEVSFGRRSLIVNDNQEI